MCEEENVEGGVEKFIEVRVGSDGEGDFAGVSITVRDDSADIEKICEIVLEILDRITAKKEMKGEGVEII